MNEAEAFYTEIPDGSDLVAWFGCVPSFHDAEIVRLDLHRRAPSTLSIHAWNMTKEVDDRDYLVLDNHAVVTFLLEDILDLQLDGFSHQNVIGGTPPAPRAGTPRPTPVLLARSVTERLRD
jgi:hypothetical protein